MLGVEIARWRSKRLYGTRLGAIQHTSDAHVRCWKAMKSEDVIVKSEGTLHTSPFFDKYTGITYGTLGHSRNNRVHCVLGYLCV